MSIAPSPHNALLTACAFFPPNSQEKPQDSQEKPQDSQEKPQDSQKSNKFLTMLC